MPGSNVNLVYSLHFAGSPIPYVLSDLHLLGAYTISNSTFNPIHKMESERSRVFREKNGAI